MTLETEAPPPAFLLRERPPPRPPPICTQLRQKTWESSWASPAGAECFFEGGVGEVEGLGDRLVGAVTVEGVDAEGERTVAFGGLDDAQIGQLYPVRDGG